MADHECIIGMYQYVDYADVITLSDLKREMEDRKRINEVWKNENTPYAGCFIEPEYTLTQYADRRFNTGLSHFNYCPVCGKKIDWKELREKDG